MTEDLHIHCANCKMVIDEFDAQSLMKGEHNNHEECIVQQNKLYEKAQAMLNQKNELVRQAAEKEAKIRAQVEEQMRKDASKEKAK